MIESRSFKNFLDVYPVKGGDAVQLAEGTVVKIKLWDDDDKGKSYGYGRKVETGGVATLQVKTTGRTSRYNPYRGKDEKIVTLRHNAGSVVRPAGL